MRGFHELPTTGTSRALRALATIEQVALEDRDTVLAVLDSGLDFADALHLASIRVLADSRHSTTTGEAGNVSRADATCPFA